jgi:uncharacterized protein with beta-barrel porin domain
VVGGSAGSSGHGGNVRVVSENNSRIVTLGDGAFGILAQSVGGGGGTGGVGAAGEDGTVAVGGAGGAAGNGGNVEVTVAGNIDTAGEAAHGILAQSVGGGGGIGGNVDRGIDRFGTNLALSRSGGSGGDGGAVTVDNTGDIATRGTAAYGIFAQSVGGGGGLAGGIGQGFGFAGSVGGNGDGGRVEVVHTGNITTYGDHAHGIFAQSVGGADYGGDVIVTVSGDITVHGEGALAVIAQSEGTAGKRNINVVYEGGTITGNSTSAVSLQDGQDNTFTNHGTITTFGGIGGMAISGASGNETIENHGTTIGSVDLGGGGNDFHNNPSGIFDAGAIVRLGQGNTLTNAGLLSPGGSGTALTTVIDGNLVQTGSGVFEAEVYSDGEHDRLLVTGDSAQLDGTLQIVREQGLYRNGTTYSLLEVTGAQGISGSLGNLLLPESKPLLCFYVNQLSNALEVEVHAPSNTTVATNRVERTVADYLDRITPTASGDLADVLGEFQSLSLPAFGTAFSSMSPDAYDNATRISYQLGGEFTRSLQQRLGTVRSYLHARGPNQDRPILLAFAGSDADLGQVYPSPSLSQVQGRNGLWFNAFGQWGDQDSNDGFTGYDYDMRVGALGFDHALADGLIVGLSAGLSRADIDLDLQQGEGRIENFSGAVYGSYFTKRLYVDGAFAYGRNRYDNQRLVTIGSIQRSVSSDHEGDLFSAYLGGGYVFDVSRWLIGPFGTICYSYLKEDGFTETGADSLNLVMDKRNTDALVSELGLRVFRVLDVNNGILIPELSAAWSYDFDIDDRVIRASLAGASGTSFAIAGQDVEKHGVIAGAGLTYVHQRGISTALKYKGEFREAYMSNGIMGEIRLTF